MFIKGVFALSVVALCFAEPPVNNNYLPPSTGSGYNYPTPSVPFPPPSKPTPPPYSPPTPARPPTNTYGPPSRPPTYQPPPTAPPSRPTYGPPPSGPPSYPTGPNYIGGGSNNAPTYGENDHLNMPHVPGMPYDFNYAVKDDYYGTDYSHNAVSDGDVVRGEYRVQLPDGRLQIVKYTADWKTGFHADVSYEGQASYPQASAGYPAAGKPPGPSYGPPTGGY